MFALAVSVPWKFVRRKDHQHWCATDKMIHLQKHTVLQSVETRDCPSFSFPKQQNKAGAGGHMDSREKKPWTAEKKSHVQHRV